MKDVIFSPEGGNRSSFLNILVATRLYYEKSQEIQ
jgi:hypothetical protein